MDGSVASVTLVVTTILSPPFTDLRRSPEGRSEFVGNDRFEGYIPDLIQMIAETVGFNYELSLVPDGQYGSLVRRGEWNGMIKELITQRADIAAAALTIGHSREHVVDFTQPFMHSRVAMLSRKPDRWFDENGCVAFSENFETFEELANQTEVKYGVMNGGATRFFFRASMVELYEKIWYVMSSARPSVFVNSTAEGVGRVLAGNYVYIGESSTLEFVANQACELQVRGSAGAENGFGLAVQQGSPLGELISTVILQLKETGYLERLKLKWWGSSHCG